MTPTSALRRCRSDRMIGGVVGGLARHWGLNSRDLRIAYVVLSILSAAFPGTLVYLILWWLIPLED